MLSSSQRARPSGTRRFRPRGRPRGMLALLVIFDFVAGEDPAEKSALSIAPRCIGSAVPAERARQFLQERTLPV